MTDETTSADGAPPNNQSPPSDDADGKFYTFFVDGDEYQTDESSLTAREIMERADIPIDVGLILIHDDGTEEQLDPDDEVEFDGPGRRLKQAPQFKRGSVDHIDSRVISSDGGESDRTVLGVSPKRW